MQEEEEEENPIPEDLQKIIDTYQNLDFAQVTPQSIVNGVKGFIQLVNGKDIDESIKKQLLGTMREILLEKQFNIEGLDLPQPEELKFEPEEQKVEQVEQPIQELSVESGEQEEEKAVLYEAETLYAKPFENDEQFNQEMLNRDKYLEKNINKFSKYYWYFDPNFDEEIKKKPIITSIDTIIVNDKPRKIFKQDGTLNTNTQKGISKLKPDYIQNDLKPKLKELYGDQVDDMNEQQIKDLLKKYSQDVLAV